MGDKRYTNFYEWYEAVGKTLTDKKYCSIEAWDAGLNSNYEEDKKVIAKIKQLEEQLIIEVNKKIELKEHHELFKNEVALKIEQLEAEISLRMTLDEEKNLRQQNTRLKEAINSGLFNLRGFDDDIEKLNKKKLLYNTLNCISTLEKALKVRIK